FPATAWVFLALLRAHAQPALRRDAAARARLDEHTAQVWQSMRAFYDPTCGAWHLRLDQAARNLYGEAELDNEHYASVLNAALAAWALVEARRLGVALEGRDELLAKSARWLVRHYIPAARGWGAHFYPGDRAFTPNETADDYRDGLSFQVYAVLLAIE